MTADRIGVVAGSGIELSPLLDAVERRLSFQDAGLAPPSIPGHAGEFIVGECDGSPIVVQRGRLHFYEGCDFRTVTRTVDTMRDLGAAMILFTNAAGGLRLGLTPGTIMAIHGVRLWPFAHWQQPDDIELSFVVDGTDAEGSFCWVHGPTYETHAETALLQRLGADAVGMSTAPELARCRELGIAAGAIACITNDCLTPHTLSHEEVITVASAASRRLAQCIREWIRLRRR